MPTMKPKDVVPCLSPTQVPLLPDSYDAKEGKGDEKAPVPVWKSVGIMGLNVLLTVSIVMINKVLFTNFDCSFAPTLLLTLHQLTCVIGTQFGRSATPCQRSLPGANMLVAAIVLTRIGGNVLVNLSLKYISVGMYQLYKMLQVPFVFMGEVLFMNVPFRASIVLTLVALLTGVGLATVNDLSFSCVGTLCGCVAPFMAAANALLLKHIQVKLDISGNELLRHICPWVVLIQLFVIPFTDNIEQIPLWFHTASVPTFAIIALSCFIAWGLEWSFLVVLQYTSAMSVQVLGHVKTMLILSIGVFLFNSALSPKGSLGITIAFGAVMAYTAVKAKDASIATTSPVGDRRHTAILWYMGPVVLLGGLATFLVVRASQRSS